MNAPVSGSNIEDEALQALIDSVDETVPSSLVFVSGGSYRLGSAESEDVPLEKPAGSVIEYKITQTSRQQVRRNEQSVFEDPQLADSLQSGRILESDALITEFKQKQRRRDQNTSQKQRSWNSGDVRPNLASPASQTSASNLRISGLMVSVTPELLKRTFSCYGLVLSAKVMVPRDERIEQKKTLGFVLFSDHLAAQTAKMERDGSILCGSIINVDHSAVPKPKKLTQLINEANDSLDLSSPSSLQKGSSYSLNRGTDPIMIPIHLQQESCPLLESDISVLESILHSITPTRSIIREAMEWAIEHQASAPDVVEIISQFLLHGTTNLLSKVACLFLISDILHNAHYLSLSVPEVFGSAWLFSASFYNTLPSLLRCLGDILQIIPSRISSQFFRDQVLSTLATWKTTPPIFMPLFVDKLVLCFLHPGDSHCNNPSPPSIPTLEKPIGPGKTSRLPLDSSSGHDIDGTPISAYPIDGGLTIDYVALLEEELGRPEVLHFLAHLAHPPH